MKQAYVTAAVLATLVGFAGAAGAQPNTVPVPTGEASTQSRTGEANPTQRPDGSDPISREAVKAEARAQNRNNANSSVPKGEASTTMNHQPNAMLQPGMKSRAEVSAEARKTKPQFGEKGERPAVPTNPTNKTGTPQ